MKKVLIFDNNDFDSVYSTYLLTKHFKDDNIEGLNPEDIKAKKNTLVNTEIFLLGLSNSVEILNQISDVENCSILVFCNNLNEIKELYGVILPNMCVYTADYTISSLILEFINSGKENYRVPLLNEYLDDIHFGFYSLPYAEEVEYYLNSLTKDMYTARYTEYLVQLELGNKPLTARSSIVSIGEHLREHIDKAVDKIIKDEYVQELNIQTYKVPAINCNELLGRKACLKLCEKYDSDFSVYFYEKSDAKVYTLVSNLKREFNVYPIAKILGGSGTNFVSSYSIPFAV